MTASGKEREVDYEANASIIIYLQE